MSTPAWYDYIHWAPPPNDAFLWIVILGGIITFSTAWSIGANDTGNNWGSSIGSKSISVRNAAILAGIFEVVGAFALGATVGGTLKSKIISPESFCSDNYSLVVRMIGMASVDVGAFIWIFFCTMLGIPVSTTHAAVGGVTGFGIAARGWGAVVWWETLGKIFISWVTSPILSCIIAFILQWSVKRFLFRGKPGSIYRKNFKVLPILAGLFLGVAAVFAYYIGGKSNTNMKSTPAWAYVATFFGVAVGMMIILSLAAWWARRKWNIDLHQYDNDTEAEEKIEVFRETTGTEDEMGYNYPVYTEGEGFADVEVPNPLTNTRAFTSPAPDSGNGVDDNAPVPYNVDDNEVQDGDKAESDSKGDALIATKSKKNKASVMNGEMMEGSKDIYEGLSKEVIAANQLWRPLCCIVACVESFSHGANDVGNAIGPYAALIDSYNNKCPKGSSTIPYWVMGLGAGGILTGLVTYGHHVIKTMGVDIAVITPQRSAIAEMGAVVTILLATALEIPVSTTHCCVGAITGVSLVEGWRFVNWKTIRNVIFGIFVTFPAVALMVAAVFSLWTAAVFGPTYPGPYVFNQYCNATTPGPWNGSASP